jgi:hypothetical protein
MHRSIAGAERGALAAATELRARQVSRLGTRSLDRSLLDRLPPRSHVPFLARQWDEAVADLSVFLARWDVTPGGHSRWGWALGPRSNQPDLEHERRQIAARLVDVTVAAAQEAAHEAGYELPDWARTHLARHAAFGTCAHHPAELRSLYARIEDYRQAVGVETTGQPRNAEEVIFGDLPEDDALRMRRRSLIEESLPREGAVARPVLGRA